MVLKEFFFAPSENEARKLCQIIWEEVERDKFIYKRTNDYLYFISHVYQYSPKERTIIGSTNIISFIATITQILMGHIPLPSINNNIRFANLRISPNAGGCEVC
jgi:hypothetical protein